jgi:hypothetical protein
MTTKQERAEIIERRSREMAESGNYRDYTEIEFALRAQGFEEARNQLDSPATRGFLNDICVAARKRKSNT